MAARPQYLRLASAGGVALPESELAVSTLSRLLLPRVMVQGLQLDLKVWRELLNQLVWSLPQWLFRIPVQCLTQTMMRLQLRLR